MVVAMFGFTLNYVSKHHACATPIFKGHLFLRCSIIPSYFVEINIPTCVKVKREASSFAPLLYMYLDVPLNLTELKYPFTGCDGQ